MISTHSSLFTKIRVAAVLLVMACIFLLSGCSCSNKLDKSITGPQVVVNPDVIRLGVANVTGMDIIFEGSGFQPDDSVFITLAGPKDTQVAVADSKVNPDGTFQAAVTPLAKVTGILRANITGTYSEDGKYNQILVITQDPIKPGVYTAVATGMLSDQSAETKITFRRPAAANSLKDWLGKRTGKIQDKRGD
ncbi:MAG TPA: hypothetical protein ENN23_07025 [Deltaproteobacteria bacterium]|nr:hypothetical protein [Deltaproteobacteria bacterium]